MDTVLHIAAASWAVFQESAVYMLFGFFMAAVLHVVVAPEHVTRYLGKGKVRSVFLAALFGVPIPLCSCGVVPAAAGLKRQGANRGATLSFLISTPETGVDSIPITYALMDPFMTVIRPIAAFITAIAAGLAENFMGKAPEERRMASGPDSCRSDNCGCGVNDIMASMPVRPRFSERVRSGFRFAFVELLADIGKWFVTGVLLAGVIASLVPDDFFYRVLGGHGVYSMLVMLVAGIPMYVCATSSTPIAAALLLKGLSPGAALVFLLAGPATNVASLSMVSGLLGKRSLMIYIGSIGVCSLALGGLTNIFYAGFGLSAHSMAGRAAEIIPEPVEWIAAAILLVLLGFSTWKSRRTGGSCSCGE